MSNARKQPGIVSTCTPAEERLNAWTHGIATACALVLLIGLVIAASMQGEPRRITSVSIFGACLVLLYGASTCYHLCPGGPRRLLLQAWDHAAIFLLIAGSYTPFLVVLVRGAWGWSLMSVLWSLAALGTFMKFRSVGDREWLSTLIYLAMGWVGIVAAKPFFGSMPGGCIAWILAGGLVYTVGVIFFVWDRLPFNHGIWHLFVAAGSACHVVAVIRYVLPTHVAG